MIFMPFSAKDRPVDQNVKEFMMSDVADAVTRETKPNFTTVNRNDDIQSDTEKKITKYKVKIK